MYFSTSKSREPSFSFLTCLTVPYLPRIDFSTAKGESFVSDCSEYVGFITINFGKLAFRGGFLDRSCSCSLSESEWVLSSSLCDKSALVRFREEGFKLRERDMGLYGSLPCFPSATECQQGRCQRNADLQHFDTRNTGTTYSDHREYDKRLRSLQTNKGINDMDQQDPESNEMREKEKINPWEV